MHPRDDDQKSLKIVSIDLRLPTAISVLQEDNRHIVSEDRALDYCIFRTIKDPGIPPVSLDVTEDPTPKTPIANVGFPLFVRTLQEKFGGPFQERLDKCFGIGETYQVFEDKFHHTSFTLQGSSGSILFNPRTGAIIGLHKVFDLYPLYHNKPYWRLGSYCIQQPHSQEATSERVKDVTNRT